MTDTSRRRTPLVVCGDWEGVDFCGVAHSERALLAELSPAPTVVDPSDVTRALRAARDARRRGVPVLLVFPTRSTVAQWRPLLTFLLIALLRRGDDLRVHLHEYRIFREVRWALNVVLLVGRPTVVVSSDSERRCMARSIAARLGRVRPVVIPPFGPLPPSTTGRSAVDAAGSGIVGVFGSPGPAKGTGLIVEVLRHLPSSFGRLELVGSEWQDVVWPADVLDKVEVAPLGFVPSAELGPVFERWELAVAPFSSGASDGRSSLRIPLSHGIPTLTVVDQPEDLTLRPSHLGIVGHDPEGTIARAVALAADREARRLGACEVDDFEQRARRLLRLVLCGSEADPPGETPSPDALA